ncbi:MAG: hypothetical protein E6Q40_07130 [Cupriavidus sp.]|nr:MAG: hypothetical protein E6Q40_07130 [Cupriavidus sp.]
MFARFFNTLAFSAAVDVVVKALRAMSVGPCPFDPVVLAHEAVAELWRIHPGILSGALEKRPDPVVVAALALGLIVDKHDAVPDVQRIMILAMASVLAVATSKGEEGLLRPAEMMITLSAQEIYFRVTDARAAKRDAIAKSEDGIFPGMSVDAAEASRDDIQARLLGLDRKLADVGG